ncbi:tetratricopeptide repeat protein [Lutimonas saemankumensis]|uniref:tetratricopeptide repeat-containing sensor histidine kinase n=1 Tax=Lutimonas saemankumensis TaxID=483016 RepID=UPI001CD6DB81|nr:tetratricopeptide repeat-containing sensor histidine kinase [Lutimonas saemankumensis]MCA0931723.1 tetratricopeptide repeat protein [Lutimonas saemankumensis]
MISCKPKTESFPSEDLSKSGSRYSQIERLPSKSNADFHAGLEIMNEALAQAIEENNDSLQLLIFKRKSYFLYKLKMMDSAKVVSYKYKQLAQKLKDTAFISNSYKRLARIHSKQHQNDSSFIYHSDVIGLLKSNKANMDSVQIAQNLLNMAIILEESGNDAESMELSLEALELLKNFADSITKASLYNNLAIISKSESDYPEALYWYDKAIQTTPVEKNRLLYLSNVANVYRYLGDYDRSEELCRQVLDHDLIHKDGSERIRVRANLAYSKWLRTKDVQYEKELLDLLDVSKKEGYLREQIEIHRKLAWLYAELNPEKGKYHSNKFYSLAREANKLDEQIEGLKILMKQAREDSGEYKRYATRYIYLKDSLETSKKGLTHIFGKYKFDTQQNREELASLKMKELENELELRKSKQQNIIYIGLGVISILGFIVVTVTIRNNYKREKVEEVYRTETRISKKLHDEVANDLYQVMNQMDKAESKQVHIIDNLEQIYQKTRDISRENNELNVEKDFEESLADLFTAYKNENLNVITKGINQINWSEVDILKKRGLYRVLQELMTNMAKHSKADLVVLSFKKTNWKIEVIYKDNGVGCELAKNNGLLNVENRIHSLNGKITLVSSTGKGFKASIII